MTPEEARRRIEELSEALRRYQHEYYVASMTTVSDAEYDLAFDRLVSLERQFPDLRRPDSPTQRIGSDLTAELPEVRHTIPVLSLDKAYTAADLQAWIEKSARNAGRELSYVVEEKIDGASIVLYYEEGLLARAVTRGNGEVGNDVTGNVRTIRAVPLRLSRAVTVAVRGEIFLPRSLFAGINAGQETPYANPRNLASGTLRRVKSREVARVPLDIFVYEGYFAPPCPTHLETLAALAELGFKLNPRSACFAAGAAALLPPALPAGPGGWHTGAPADIPAYLERAAAERSGLDYDIDGLVIKVNELEARELLGFTGHHPRWALAFKFEAPEAETRVVRIEIQVGRTGRITPVARVEPVLLSGSTIANATLHNQDTIDLLELAEGDTVSISKRGDVIPAVERVVDKNESGHTTWKMPAGCPSCGTELVRRGAHRFCPNRRCPAQVRGKIHFFAARGQMDIENLGPETLDLLIREGLVTSVVDLYRFDPEALAGLPGFGPKKIRLIKAGIEKSKTQPYRVVLQALGIPELGPRASELLIEAGFRDITCLLEAAREGDPERFINIHGIGEKIAATLIEAFSDPEIIEIVAGLREAGLRLREEPGTGGPPEARSFAGQSWCITGSFESFKPRELAGEEIKKRGGRVVGAVTSATTHLLCGAGAGSKLARARALGTRLVSEEEFRRLLGAG
jgi:DNA ligase (NAD+)